MNIDAAQIHNLLGNMQLSVSCVLMVILVNAAAIN